MLDKKWNLMSSDLKDGACAPHIAGAVSKSGIKESRIVNSELTDLRVHRHHLGGELRRNAYPLFGSQDVKVRWLKDQALLAGIHDCIPKILRRIVVHVGKIDHRRILLGFVGDHFSRTAAAQ